MKKVIVMLALISFLLSEVAIVSASVTATIDLHPNSLNLKSKGKWITGYIELPEGYDVADINVSTIMINDTLLIDPSAPSAIGDYDNDTIMDLMVKFNRTEVSEFILLQGIKFGNIALNVTGQLDDGTFFEDMEIVRVKMPGDTNMDGKVDGGDIAQAAKAWISTPTHARWNALADENEDNKIDGLDIVAIARNYGKIYA
jgi:hypothetical protein